MSSGSKRWKMILEIPNIMFFCACAYMLYVPTDTHIHSTYIHVYNTYNIHTYIYTYTKYITIVHAYAHIYTRIHICTYIHTNAHTCTHTHVHVHMRAFSLKELNVCYQHSHVTSIPTLSLLCLRRCQTTATMSLSMAKRSRARWTPW